MAKNKKTRRQKTIADLRRQLSVTQTSSPAPQAESPKQTPSRPQYSFTTPAKTIPQKTLSTVQTPFVLKDLRRTAIITAGIVIAQILLFVLMNAHS